MRRFVLYLGLLGVIAVVILTTALVFFLIPYLPVFALILTVAFGVSLVGLMGFGATWSVLHLQGKYRANQIIHRDNIVAYHFKGDILHLSAMQAAAGTRVIESTPQQLTLPPASSMLPQAPRYRDMAHTITGASFPLGFSSDGAIDGNVSDLLSMGMVGKPGTGKSSALLYYLAVFLKTGVSVEVFDPHGSLNELSQVLSYTDDLDEISLRVPELHRELYERSELYKRSKQVRKPLLLLVDELPVISRWEQKNRPEYSVLELVERIVLEGRKWNCYVILSGQSLPAEVLPTLTRDNLSSRIVFNSSASHARMVGLDEESRKKLYI